MPFPLLSPSFCLPLSSFQALFVSFSHQLSIAFLAAPHLTHPLFLCPLLHRNNGLLTAFQLPQGLRGLDGCRMLMHWTRHWASATHTAERREDWRSRDMRLCQGDKAQKVSSLIPFISMTQICLLHAHTSATPHTYCEVMYTAWPQLLRTFELLMVGLTHVIYVSDRKEGVELVTALCSSFVFHGGWG